MENVDLNNNEERNETDSGKNERIVANKRMQWKFEKKKAIVNYYTILKESNID